MFLFRKLLINSLISLVYWSLNVVKINTTFNIAKYINIQIDTTSTNTYKSRTFVSPSNADGEMDVILLLLKSLKEKIYIFIPITLHALKIIVINFTEKTSYLLYDNAWLRNTLIALVKLKKRKVQCVPLNEKQDWFFFSYNFSNNHALELKQYKNDCLIFSDSNFNLFCVSLAIAYGDDKFYYISNVHSRFLHK